MRQTRTTASILAIATLSLLAACGGGGGGGGGVTPPAGGGGGNGGGGNGGGGATPTPVPIATSTPAPSGTTITAEENWGPNGAIWYNSGVTASWTHTAGDTNTNFSGIDGMTCQHIVEGGGAYPSTQYAQHSFVGIFYNGAEQALPQAIGMNNPTEPKASGHPNDYYEVEDNTCEYQMHTHDYSGLVHVADPSLPQSTTNPPAYANLQTLVDEWGATLNASGLTAGSNSLSGATTIYEGTPSGKDANGNDLVTSYAPVATASAVVIGHHTAIWIVIGTPPASLPNVRFVLTN